MNQFYQLSGLHCAACAAAVEKALAKLPGLLQVEVNPLTQKLRVDLAEPLADELILACVREAGFDGEVIESKNSTGSTSPKPSNGKPLPPSMVQRYEQTYRDNRRRFFLSLLLMLPLMLLSMGEMLGLSMPSLFSSERPLSLAFWQLILSLPVFFLHSPMLKRGLVALSKGRSTMDSLIGVGTLAAVTYSLLAMLNVLALPFENMASVAKSLPHRLYFESAVMILTLVALGKTLEAKAKKKTGEAIESLLKLVPEEVLRETETGELETCPIEEVCVGDVLRLRPGEAVAVDGVVLDGLSSLDAAALTGESLPIEKQAGDSVLSGMVNLSGSLRYRAEKPASSSSLAKVIQLVEEASSSKAPISKIVDRVSAVFVPVVLLLALLTFAVWSLLGDGQAAVEHAIAVLVISCPCALGLATPVAIMLATGQAAKYGVLFQSAEAIEACGQVQTLIFDKTGTLTQGKARVQAFYVKRGESSREVLTAVASLEAVSEHPLAQAILALADQKGLKLESIQAFRAKVGYGVEGIWRGLPIVVGRARYLEEAGILFWAELDELAQALEQQGQTCLYVAINHRLVAVLAVSDSIKPEAKAVLKKLRSMGLELELLSGDQKRVAEAIGSRLHMDAVRAECLPEDKLNYILAHQKEGKKVMMLGDGINDAPALVQADVGLAMGNGTDIAMQAADLVLMGSRLGLVPFAIHLSKMTKRIIRHNLFWAFLYNVLLIPVAAGLFEAWHLHISPMWATLAMSLSSLFVLSNSMYLTTLRLESFEQEGEIHEVDCEEIELPGESSSSTESLSLRSSATLSEKWLGESKRHGLFRERT